MNTLIRCTALEAIQIISTVSNYPKKPVDKLRLINSIGRYMADKSDKEMHYIALKTELLKYGIELIYEG